MNEERRMLLWRRPLYGGEHPRSCSASSSTIAKLSMQQQLLLLLLLLLLPAIQVAGDDKDALLAFRNAVDPRQSLPWSSSNSCQWEGITCRSGTARVQSLRLPGSGLVGVIPPGTIGNLTELQYLSLRSNRLSGTLPSDLRNCASLRSLSLPNNNFSGPLPSNFSLWPNLQRIDLSDNNFSGSIPSSLNSLPRLRTLYLQKNSFTGSLPALDISTLENFSVANNELNGSIPSTQTLQKFPSNSFAGNNLCGLPLVLDCASIGAPSPAPSSTGAPSPTPSGAHKKSNKLGAGAIVGIVLGVVGFLLLLAVIWLLILRRGKKEQDSAAPRNVQMPEIGVIDTSENLAKPEFVPADAHEPADNKLVFFEGDRQTFDLEDLLRASAEVLGKGSMGTAYKAILEDGTVVAVKRLRDVLIERKDFEEKMWMMGRLKHENLVPMLAYFFSKDEKLLVFDFMPGGSLSALLHGTQGAGRRVLDWETRIQIALSAARGIAFLHKGNNIGRFTHGNIKSSNILLSSDLNACVSDYGLSQLCSSSNSAVNRISGYRAPEVTDINKMTQKADVYSYGVLLLELLTGRAPLQSSHIEEGIDLPRWVQSVVQEEWTAEVFDLELMRYQTVEEAMLQTLQVAMACVSPSPDQRPTMNEVVEMIEEARNIKVPINNNKKFPNVNDLDINANGSEIDDRVI